MKRPHSLSFPDTVNPPSSPPSSPSSSSSSSHSPGVKRPCETTDDSPDVEIDHELSALTFLTAIEENADLPLAERESLVPSASEVNKLVLTFFMKTMSLCYSVKFELNILSCWLPPFNRYTLWLTSILALKVENHRFVVSDASDTILQVAESGARNVPHDLPHCCSLSLLLVNLMLTREEGSELDELIAIVHSFQLVCSPVNLLINFMLGQTVYSSVQDISNEIPSLDVQLPFIRILSGSANGRSVILSVISRLVNHPLHSFSLNIINPDGSYPLHQAVLACLSGYTPASFVVSLIELGAYPYSYSQSELCCTPFELTPDKLNFHVTGGGFSQLRYIRTECERVGILSRVPPLRTLCARCVSNSQINTNNFTVPPPIREFITWHQFDPLKLYKDCNEEDLIWQLFEECKKGERKRYNLKGYMARLLYDPPTVCDEYSFFANAHHTPGGVLETLLQQPWNNT